MKSASCGVILRYDNTAHYPDLPNSPHHKHDGDEDAVVPSSAPDLSAVLREIETLLPIE